MSSASIEGASVLRAGVWMRKTLAHSCDNQTLLSVRASSSRWTCDMQQKDRPECSELVENALGLSFHMARKLRQDCLDNRSDLE